MRPAIKPITYAAHGCTLKQPAEIPTKPAMTPLQIDPKSYFLILDILPIMCDFKRVVIRPEAEPDKIVFIKIFGTELYGGKNIVKADPPFRKSQQTHNRIVPITLSEKHSGVMDSFSHSVSLY